MIHCASGVVTCVPTPKCPYQHYDRLAVWKHLEYEQRRFQGKKDTQKNFFCQFKLLKADSAVDGSVLSHVLLFVVD